MPYCRDAMMRTGDTVLSYQIRPQAFIGDGVVHMLAAGAPHKIEHILDAIHHLVPGHVPMVVIGRHWIRGEKEGLLNVWRCHGWTTRQIHGREPARARPAAGHREKSPRDPHGGLVADTRWCR